MSPDGVGSHGGAAGLAPPGSDLFEDDALNPSPDGPNCVRAGRGEIPETRAHLAGHDRSRQAVGRGFMIRLLRSAVTADPKHPAGSRAAEIQLVAQTSGLDRPQHPGEPWAAVFRLDAAG